MYVVSYFNTPGPMPIGIFPNVFPDFDLAYDCVVSQIKGDFDIQFETLELVPFISMGGQQVFKYDDAVYCIGKLFNFNPKVV